MRTRQMLLVVAALLAALVVVGVGRATPPGQNGLISYRVYFDPDHSTGALFVMNRTGRIRRRSPTPARAISTRTRMVANRLEDRL